MENRPKISIGMIARNAEKYVEDTIRSVLAQRDPSWELLIRNNGSTDRTGEICERFAAEDPRIHVFHNKENYMTDDGYSVYKREFWPLCRCAGAYTATLDADDILHPDFVGTMYQRATETDADIVACGYTYFPDGEYPFTSTTGKRKIPPELEIHDMQELSLHFPTLIYHLKLLAGKIYKAEFWNQWFAFSMPAVADTQRFTTFDVYFILSIAMKMRSMASVSVPLYYWRQRADSYYHSITEEGLPRIPQSLTLYERGIQCLSELDIVTPQNVDSIYDILVGNLITVMRGVSHSAMDLEKRMVFLRRIATESDYPDPYFFDASWGKFRESFLASLRPFAHAFGPEQLRTEWLFRLYLGMSEEEGIAPELRALLLYSAVFDEGNVNGFGAEELRTSPWGTWAGERLLRLADNTRVPATTLRSRGFCKNMLSGGLYTEVRELNEKKQTCSQLLDGGRQEEAEAVHRELRDIAPLDPSVIYNGGRLLHREGDRRAAAIAAACGCALYPEDRFLSELFQAVSEGRP